MQLVCWATPSAFWLAVYALLFQEDSHPSCLRQSNQETPTLGLQCSEEGHGEPEVGLSTNFIH